MLSIFSVAFMDAVYDAAIDVDIAHEWGESNKVWHVLKLMYSAASIIEKMSSWDFLVAWSEYEYSLVVDFDKPPTSQTAVQFYMNVIKHVKFRKLLRTLMFYDKSNIMRNAIKKFYFLGMDGLQEMLSC